MIESLRRLPKVQLHCHLEGAVAPQTYVELARQYGLPLPAGDAGHPYAFSNFEEFLLTFQHVCRALRTPADYVRVLREYADNARTHNVMYAELFVSPSVWRFFHPTIDIAQVCTALWEEARIVARQGGPEIRFIYDLTRNFGAESALASACLAATLQPMGFIGIGLGGDEVRFPATLFAEAFAYARTSGLHCVAHAGESAGPASVRDAVMLLGAERIGHGIRAIDDPAVIALLIERGVPLEICPTSNFKTAVARAAAHPLRELTDAGVMITIDSDDPAVFQTDITAEYAFAANEVGVERTLEFARNAITASFADGAAKASLMRRFERASADLFPKRRT
ncbi:MAG: adenosine deaminase [Vulcanimicrobiaceae bacterium]